MRFIATPDLDRIYTSELMDEIRASIHPSGDCGICRNPLGDNPVRIQAHGAGNSLAMFVPTHASCGPAPTYGTVALAPRATHATFSIIRPFPHGGGRPIHGELGLVAVNPSLDIHGSHEIDGAWSRPIDTYRRYGLTSSVDHKRPADLPPLPDGTCVQLAGGELRIGFGNVWTAAVTSRFYCAIEACSGFVVAISHRITPDMLLNQTETALKDLMTGPASAFAWVPISTIETVELQHPAETGRVA